MESERDGMPMSSSSQKVVNKSTRTANISSETAVHRPSMPSPQQNPYDQESDLSAMQDPSEYSSQQNEPHQHDSSLHDYVSNYPDDISLRPSHNPIHQYPSVSGVNLYPRDINAPLSGSIPTVHQVQPVSPLEDYHTVPRGHHLRAHNLEQQQRPSLDRPNHLQNVASPYRQAHLISYPAASDAPASSPLQHSHPPHPLVPSSSYDSVNNTTNTININPSHSSDARSVGTTHRSAPYRTSPTPSSIPMSNKPPPHHNIHAHSDFKSPLNSRHDHLPLPLGQNVNAHVATAATLQETVHSTVVHRDASDLVLAPMSGPTTSHHLDFHPRSRSIPDSAYPLPNLSPTHSLPAPSRNRHSPPAASDTESTFGSELIPNEENEDRDFSLRLRLPGQADGQPSASLVKGKEKGKRDHENTASGIGEGKPRLVTAKKKKSKMHECQICQKKFPRPSGLKTHMNTHSNERRCPRTFGVRSNAKRHLRTHGIFPNPPDPGPVEVPYVVGFTTPMILQPHQRDIPQHDSAGEGSSSAQPGSEDAESTQSLGQEKREHSSLKIPPYRVRWMPPSSTIRANASQGFPDDKTQPRSSRKGKQRQTSDEKDEDDYDEDEYNSQTAKEVDDEDMDDESREARIFGDAAVASRLSMPFPHVVPSSGSSSWSGAVEPSQSGSGLSRTVSSLVSRSQSPSLYSVSFSASHSATSSTLPQSASMSPVNQPGEYASRWVPNFPNLDQDEAADCEERTYLPTGSHSNTPSQHRDKKAR